MGLEEKVKSLMLWMVNAEKKMDRHECRMIDWDKLVEIREELILEL